jgi:ferredoxin
MGMKKASLCGLGQTAANPVLSTMNYFADEYRAHLFDKKCPAGKCISFFNYKIVAEKCKRCGLCKRTCPVGAISGDKQGGFVIDPAKCIQCGRCFEACKFDSIVR